MLNSIANPEIKSQLDKLRPKAPTVSIAPGFYSQYITVDLSSDSGKLYVTTNGEYPSIYDAVYAEPISLVEGENTIIALSVSDNGLVSSLSTFGYIVGGLIEEVDFADSAISRSLHDSLEISDDKPIFTNDLWNITDFTIPEDALVYSDLKHLPYLESLTIENGVSSELHNISSLSNLSKLDIVNCTVSEDDLIRIASLPVLKYLRLQNCGISNISQLSEARSLISLDLNSNAIRNLSPLASLNKLQELNLHHNAITTLSDLASLSALKVLNVSNNSLISIAPVSNLTNLTHLDADSNRITDLGDINQLTSLTHLSMANNSITDVVKLAACTALTELNISSNMITDISSFHALVKLTYFNFSYNQVLQLPPWPSDCSLITLDGAYNQLTSIDALSGMQSLNNVYMDYNEGIESVEALASCPVLIQVDVYGTKVADVTSLTNQSVIVHYTPVQIEEE